MFKKKEKKAKKLSIKEKEVKIQELDQHLDKYTTLRNKLVPEDKTKPRKLRFLAKRGKKNKKKTQYSILIRKRDGSINEVVVTTKNPDIFKYNKNTYYVTQNSMVWHRDLGMYHLEYIEGISLPLVVFHDWDKLSDGAKHGVYDEKDNIVMSPIKQHSLLDSTLFDEFCKGSYINTLLSAYKKLNDNVKLIIVLCALSFFSSMFSIVINWYFLNDAMNRIIGGG